MCCHIVQQKLTNVLKEPTPSSFKEKELFFCPDGEGSTSMNLYMATWHNIQENNNLYSQPHKNLKS
jgi:hypothetical protein